MKYNGQSEPKRNLDKTENRQRWRKGKFHLKIPRGKGNIVSLIRCSLKRKKNQVEKEQYSDFKM